MIIRNVVSSVFSNLVATNTTIGVTFAGFFILAIIMNLSDNNRKSVLTLISDSIAVFLIPFFIVMIFVFVLWAVRT